MQPPSFAWRAATLGSLCGALFSPLFAPRAAALDIPPLRSDRPPLFTADLAISLDAQGATSLSVSFTVPQSELQWIRLPRGMGAGVEWTVAISHPDGFPAGGDVWERQVVLADFRAVQTPGAVLVEQRTFTLGAGRYQVRLAVTDGNSGSRSSVQQRLDVPDYRLVPVGFADLILGAFKKDSAFVPIPTRRFGLESAQLGARAVLFDRLPGPWPRSYALHYRLRQENGEVVSEGDTTVRLARSGEPVVLQPRAGELFLGSYTLEVALAQGKPRLRVERSFEVESSGPPQGKDFAQMLEVLAYIAHPEEIDYLRSLAPEQQGKGWEEFWRRRDPTPDTAFNEAELEFFRRVRYADQHFQGIGPGWRSDMGRIYIKYGPAQQTENRPASVDSPAMEVWYYYNPYRRFFFADRDGFGRYVLLNPQAES